MSEDNKKTGSKASDKVAKSVAKKSTRFQKGVASNPAGRPRGTGRSISRLRQTITKLETMVDLALDNVEKVVSGEEVDRHTLETSKWVIATIPSMSRAATQEETFRESVKSRAEDKEFAERELEVRAKEASNGTNGARFSPNIIPFNRDDDED